MLLLDIWLRCIVVVVDVEVIVVVVVGVDGGRLVIAVDVVV